ncbi:BglG family transcription antiterminator [Pseudalkalibacillus salsuginis]|uniref:BglG family transcription antiterminator n=1 Tax=Pseudalkalibacillus salsuginis TaxID=2910972 RepID=UPI001F1C6B5D|nr:BglG family transcription antiterminator [Pseudalkalibacillus salsuginis]MCF6410181.1 BglG family transcription antiterminator [Pseudalkalibacillus salsuginis]
MYITARERKILDVLLRTKDEIPIREIADQIGVSSRTIHRDLKGLEPILKSHGIILDKKAGSGLKLITSVRNRNSLLSIIHQQIQADYMPSERQALILLKLLEANDPVKLFTLADELGVTVATISNDLDKVKSSLESFQLSLIRRRGYGVEIQGDETHIREAIGYLIMQHTDEINLLSLLREKIVKPIPATANTLSEQLLGLISKEKLKIIEQSVDAIRNSLQNQLVDSAYIALVIHLALALERIQQGETIRMPLEQLDKLKSTKEFGVARNLIEQLEDVFNITIPEAEMGYITTHLLGAKVRNGEDFSEETDLMMAFKAKQLIELVSERINVDFNQSDHLLNDLVSHLKPSLYRLQENKEIENPLTDQIERDYEELFQIVEETAHEVFPYHFPKTEIAFLVMHFASALLSMEAYRGLRVLVICSSGIGTSKILAAKLTRQFKEIEEIEHRSLFELEELDTTRYDLVVSTIALSDIDQYIQVNPMLPTSDIHKIAHVLRKIRISDSIKIKNFDEGRKPFSDKTAKEIRGSVEAIHKYAEVVDQLLNAMKVTHHLMGTYEEILKVTCQYFETEGYIDDGHSVMEALLKREQLGGLGITGTKLALFHARHGQIKQPIFTVQILAEPISIQSMDQTAMEIHTILLMLAPANIHKEGLEVLSFLSSLIVESSESVQILQSKNAEKIDRYVANQLHRFLEEKLS